MAWVQLPEPTHKVKHGAWETVQPVRPLDVQARRSWVQSPSIRVEEHGMVSHNCNSSSVRGQRQEDQWGLLTAHVASSFLGDLVSWESGGKQQSKTSHTPKRGGREYSKH